MAKRFIVSAVLLALVTCLFQRIQKIKFLHATSFFVSSKPPFSRTLFTEKSSSSSSDDIGMISLGIRDPLTGLEFDYYRENCPRSEQIVRSLVRQFHIARPDATPSLLRLVFHDCFVQGCDASVLLDSAEAEGFQSEKDTQPNETLKGFELIELIKAEIEQECPEIVSCADILVLAAREAVVLSGGPFYPLHTGRRDSSMSFPEIASFELPNPHDRIIKTLFSFASRGFNERETVALLGAHNVGIVHCKFFHNRLYNFGGSGEPDPPIEPAFLDLLRSKWNNSRARNGATMEEPGMLLNYGASSPEFGTHYFRSLVQGKGILFADQQLMASEGTAQWVRAYAADGPMFMRDFAQAMMKLSNLRVLTRPLGEIRRVCSMYP
ncbi:hypothetical protein Syun_025967 [Stephania yunnanensis]|uniref:Peroxidase n=1 Tax=Stephania yunnanensis TaxID=152371 RepID=A0AAP0HVB0_9MAGN